MATFGVSSSTGAIINITPKSSSGIKYLDLTGVSSDVQKELNEHEIRITSLEDVTANHEIRIVALENGSSQDKHFTYEQEEPSATWTIIHNLGKFPSVEIVESAGTRVFPEVQQISENVCVVKFNSAMKGKAYLN